MINLIIPLSWLSKDGHTVLVPKVPVLEGLNCSPLQDEWIYECVHERLYPLKAFH